MPVRIKRIYDEAEPADGVRVLIDRLWPRGLRKDEAGVDLWLKEAAPSTELRRWVHADPERFPEFRRRYLDELAQHPEVLDPVREHLRERRTVTLLYASRDTERNHAVVLADLLGGSKRRR